MSGSVNKVILVGNLGKDPEIRTTQEGKEIASFTIATSDSWRDKQTGARKEKTEWHRIVVFNEGLVKIVKSYLQKGAKVYVEGALSTRKWTDKHGEENYITEVVLQGFSSTLKMLDSKGGAKEVAEDVSYNSLNKTPAAPVTEAFLDDEIPF